MKTMDKRIKKIFGDFYENAKETFGVGYRVLRISFFVRKSAVILYLFGAFIETFGSIFTIYATAKLFSLLANFSSGGPTSEIWFWLIMDTLSAILIGIGFWVMYYAGRLVYFALNKWTVNAFMNVMCRIDIDDFYNEEIRNQINKARNGYTWQVPNITHMYLELIYGFMRFSAIAIVVSQINWWLILIIAMFLVPTLLSDGKIAKIQWLIWGEKGDNRHIYTGIDNMISKPKNQMEIRSMQTSDYILEKINKINNEFYNRQEKDYKKAARVSILAKILEIGGVGVGAVVLLRKFLNGSLVLESYFFLSGALFRVGGALNAIFGTLSGIQEPQQFTKNFFELIDRTPRIHDKKSPHKISSKQPLKIVFENVGFSYPGKDTVIFDNLNLAISPGEHIALVGENGAGKSTLIKLLLRFYEPTSGKILIGGIDIQDIAIDSWYSQLATLFQDFNEYPFPIKENIEIAGNGKNGSRNRLENAAKLGGIREMMNNYKHGWDTVLDSSFEKGTEPSGGQWQRVALARAFYREANMLILDEPTSAIDAKAEYDIFNNIFDHYQNKTTLIVSHRFSTVRRANRIVVLEKGKIIEEGTHGSLMKNKNLYHELFSKQAEGYKN